MWHNATIKSAIALITWSLRIFETLSELRCSGGGLVIGIFYYHCSIPFSISYLGVSPYLQSDVFTALSTTLTSRDTTGVSY